MRAFYWWVFGLLTFITITAFGGMFVGGELEKAGFERLAADPTTELFEGRQYYNTTSDKLKVYDGGAWQEIGGSSTLQEAYEAGNSITTSAGEGSLLVGGTEKIEFTNTRGILLSTGGASGEAPLQVINGGTVNPSIKLNQTNASNSNPVLWVDNQGGGPSLYLRNQTPSSTNAISILQETNYAALTINQSGNDAALNITGSNSAAVAVYPGSQHKHFKLRGRTSGDIEVKTPATITSWDWTLPADKGNNGDFLQIDTNGLSSWQSVPADTLQAAYVAGNTITTDATSGSFKVDGDRLIQLYSTAGTYMVGDIPSNQALYVNNTNTTTSTPTVQITSASTNDNSELLLLANNVNPTGTALNILGDPTTVAIQIDGQGGNVLKIKPPSAGGSVDWVLPAGQGAADTFLKNDGTGVLSWAAADSGPLETDSVYYDEGAPYVDQSNDTGTSNGALQTDIRWVGQSFTPATTNSLKSVSFKHESGNVSGAAQATASFTARLYEAGAGVDTPTGALIASSDPVLVNDLVPNQYTDWSFPSEPSLTSGTKYVVYLESVNYPANGHPDYGSVRFYREGNSTNPYPGGVYMYTTNSASSWTTQSANDMLFKVSLGGPAVAGSPNIKMNGETSGFIDVYAPDAVTSYNLTLPDEQGVDGDVLVNDGTGVLSWTNMPLYEEGSVDLSAETTGDFQTGGTLSWVRIGKQVTMSLSAFAPHPTSAYTTSAVVIPVGLRPSEYTTNVADIDAATSTDVVIRFDIDTNGTFHTFYNTWAGGFQNRTSTGSAMSVTYLLP